VTKRIAVVFGGPSPEHDISVLTGLQAARVLDGVTDGEVQALYWSKAGDWYLVPALLEASDFLDGPPDAATAISFSAVPGGGFREAGRKARAVEFDVALICCHGGPGENGVLQGALDLAGIRYAGPSAAGAALGMDKFGSVGAAKAAGIPVNAQFVLTAGSQNPEGEQALVVKPRWGGSSVGIEVVDNLDTAKSLINSSVHLRAGAVAEPYLDGWIDLNIAIRTFPSVQLSEIERPLLGDAAIYSYDAKYLSADGSGLERAPRELPAKIPGAISKAIERYAERLAPVFDVRGVARLDFLWDGDDSLVFNEINTIPGALAFYLWPPVGVSREQLLLDLIEEAVSRSTVYWSAAGADGTALQGARDIAGKLA